MRMSVLKKVSDSSKVMFSEAPADYSLEIAELRRDIGELRQKVSKYYVSRGSMRDSLYAHV